MHARVGGRDAGAPREVVLQPLAGRAVGLLRQVAGGTRGQLHAAAVGPVEPGEQPQQRRLPGAVGPDDAEHVAGRDRDGDAGEDRRRPVRLVQIARGQGPGHAMERTTLTRARRRIRAWDTRPMPDVSTLLLFAGASLALLAVPGPAVIYVVTRSLDQGRTAGVVSVLGVETGTFAYALAAAAGLTGLIAASETGFTIVRYAGAAYLVYLGVRKLLERGDALEAAASGRSQLFVKGLVVQLLNPKIAIFFLAFLPQFVYASGGPVALQILVLGTLFTLLAMLSDGAYVLLAGAAGNWLRSSRRARSGLAKLSGSVYIALGLSAALSGTSHARPTQP